jgi:hypothetical protein
MTRITRVARVRVDSTTRATIAANRPNAKTYPFKRQGDLTEVQPVSYTTIENPAVGETYHHEDEYGVYRYDTWPDGILKGQERRTMLDKFDSLEEAKAEYPTAGVSGSGYRKIHIPETPPEWFDPEAAGERWDEDD